MSAPKWGESFLKSGLPLEHLTGVVFRDLKWNVTPKHEYLRTNERNEEAWFELDPVVTCRELNRSTELSFIVECKYHDLSRNWFFLPFEPPDKFVCFDNQVYNLGPYRTLLKPYENTILRLAPLSIGGMVISADGQKQDNAVQTQSSSW